MTAISDAYIVETTTANSAIVPKAQQLQLSPRQKRKVILEILNPQPCQAGVVHTHISLYHAERYERRFFGDGMPRAVIDREALTVYFNRADVGERVFVHRIHGIPDLRDLLARARELPMCMSNATGTDLWPVIPNYTGGRPLEDFLAHCDREPVGGHRQAPAPRLDELDRDPQE